MILMKNNIEAISYYPKKKNKYYQLIPKGEIINSKFFGLFKKVAKENLYYNCFQNSYYTKDEIEKELKDSYIDPIDGEIYEKPKFKFRMRSGIVFTGYCETIEDGEEEFEKIKNDKDNYLEIKD